MDPTHALFPVTPPEFSLTEVIVRLTKPEERGRWDAWMQTHHYLGFQRFADRGLRYVFECGASGSVWQTGAFQSASGPLGRLEGEGPL